jgi:thymidylate synthase
MQTSIDFKVHDYEPSSTMAHLNENRNRFSEQCQLMYDHMIEHGSITSTDAWIMYGITRGSARICDLKKNGVNIVDEWVVSGKTKVKSYSIKSN